MKRFVALFLLTGCSTLPEKLSMIGEPPPLSRIKNPKDLPGYQPITMPMPTGMPTYKRGVNSLWEVGSRGFFKDQRAGKVGDIITVMVDINQEESIEMKPTLQRSATNNATVTNALGLQSKVAPFLRKLNPANPNWINLSSSPSLSGDAKYDITDKIIFKLAASVIQILPNGNMVIQGRQEIRLVNEVREIHMIGIVRREDITASNAINAEKIAELRISYGGRGELTDFQSFPWGQQILNKISPF